MTKNTISANKVDKMIKEYTGKPVVNKYKVGDETIEVTITPDIDFVQRAKMIDTMVKSCFDENGDYVPYFFDFAWDDGLIKNFTNLNIGDGKSGIDRTYRLARYTNICEDIQDVLGEEYEKMFRQYIDGVEYLKAKKIQSHESFDALIDQITAVLTKYENRVTSVPPEELKKFISKVNSIKEETVIDKILDKNEKTLPEVKFGE